MLNNINNIKLKYRIMNSIKEQINNIYYNYNKVNKMKVNIMYKIVVEYIKYLWI